MVLRRRKGAILGNSCRVSEAQADETDERAKPLSEMPSQAEKLEGTKEIVLAKASFYSPVPVKLLLSASTSLHALAWTPDVCGPMKTIESRIHV